LTVLILLAVDWVAVDCVVKNAFFVTARSTKVNTVTV
jgi:hypothetical protein